jgi:thiamine biosynthesis lipoprotein
LHATTPSASDGLFRDGFNALGTRVEICVGDADTVIAAVRAVREVVSDVDQACSRFRQDSELSRVNNAAGAAVPVSELFIAALTSALRAATATDGLVDPTLGTVISALGYDRDFAAVTSAGGAGAMTVQPPAGSPMRFAVSRCLDWHDVEADARRGTVTVPKGLALDLGATGKAFAADRAAERAAEVAGAVLVSIGGDLRIAGPPRVAGWHVRVADSHAAPYDAPDTQTVRLIAGGMATSSTTVRRWMRGADVLHHLVDPRTAAPAAIVWRTVTVAAATCVDANTASTAGVIAGAGAPSWLEQHRLPARLVTPDGACRYVGGWPEPPTFAS